MSKPENDMSLLRCGKGHPGMPTPVSRGSLGNNFTKPALTQKLVQLPITIVSHFKAETATDEMRHDTRL